MKSSVLDTFSWINLSITSLECVSLLIKTITLAIVSSVRSSKISSIKRLKDLVWTSKACFNASLFFDKLLIAVSTAVTNFIKSVNKHACEGVLSIHSLCCFDSTSFIDFFIIDLIVDCMFFKISTK